MRALGVWTLAVGGCLGGCLALPALAHAQPQDDAALAEVPEEEPAERGERERGERSERGERGARTIWVKPKWVATRPAVSADPPLTTEQLRHAYPDLELETTPEAMFGFFFGTLAPFQLLGIGLDADVYVMPRLRLSAFTSGGLALAREKSGRLNFYGEASLAVVVGQWRGESIVTLPIRVPRLTRNLLKEAEEPPQMRRGIVPSSHSLEVEAGMLSGQYALYRCTADCAELDVDDRTLERVGSQLGVPFAGVRYVYFRLARSRATPFRSKQRFQFAAQILTPPVNNPPAGLQNYRGKIIKQSPVGARFAVKLPGFQKNPDGFALSLDFTAGYFPSPADVILHLNMVLF